MDKFLKELDKQAIPGGMDPEALALASIATSLSHVVDLISAQAMGRAAPDLDSPAAMQAALEQYKAELAGLKGKAGMDGVVAELQKVIDELEIEFEETYGDGMTEPMVEGPEVSEGPVDG